MGDTCPACSSLLPAGAPKCATCDTPVTARVEEQAENDTLAILPSDTPQRWSQPGAAPPTRPLARGVILGGRYEIVQDVGEGGMGTVYQARDRELERMVALKVIRPDLAGSHEMLERFKKELILARQITHPNIVRIYDLGVADGYRFITMEFIEGHDLGKLLAERGKMPASGAAEIMLQVSRALEAAHAQGIIHRDLKPQNIMVADNGRVAVMDFGIAHADESSPSSMEPQPTLTQPGTLLGTPTYMSPEQARCEKVDARSDIFSAGIIFYELLTGKQPHEARTPQAMLAKRMTETAPSPAKLEPSTPRAVNRIVARCLEIDCSRRYQNAAQLTHDLQAFLGSTGRRRKRWVWPVAAAAAVLASIGAVILLRPHPSKPVQSRPAIVAAPALIAATPAQVVQQPVAIPRPAPRVTSEADRSVAPPASHPDIAADLANAHDLRIHGDLAAAEIAYKSLLKHSDSLSGSQKHQVYGEYYLLKHDPRAVQEFEALERLHGGDAGTLGGLAAAYCDSGDVSRALAAAQKALQADPGSPELRYKAALYALYTGDVERSLSESRALVKSNPSFESGYVSLGLAQLGNAQHALAENTAHKLEALGPSGKSKAAMLLADVAMFEGRYQQAASLLNSSLADGTAAHDGGAAYKMIMLSQVEMARRNPALASIWADRAVDATDGISVLEPAAEVYLETGAIPKALRQAARLAAQPSAEARAYASVVRGYVKLGQGDTPGAIELFENAELLGSKWLGEFWLGRAYLESGEFVKADAQFARCHQERVNVADLFRREEPTLHYFPPVFYYLGRTRQAMKRPLLAEKFYERFLTLKSKGEADAMVEDAVRRRNELLKPQ